MSSNELSVNVESNSEKALRHCSQNQVVPALCKDAHLAGKAQVCGSEKGDGWRIDKSLNSKIFFIEDGRSRGLGGQES